MLILPTVESSSSDIEEFIKIPVLSRPDLLSSNGSLWLSKESFLSLNFKHKVDYTSSLLFNIHNYSVWIYEKCRFFIRLNSASPSKRYAESALSRYGADLAGFSRNFLDPDKEVGGVANIGAILFSGFINCSKNIYDETLAHIKEANEALVKDNSGFEGLIPEDFAQASKIYAQTLSDMNDLIIFYLEEIFNEAFVKNLIDSNGHISTAFMNKIFKLRFFIANALVPLVVIEQGSYMLETRLIEVSTANSIGKVVKQEKGSPTFLEELESLIDAQSSLFDSFLKYQLHNRFKNSKLIDPSKFIRSFPKKDKRYHEKALVFKERTLYVNDPLAEANDSTFKQIPARAVAVTTFESTFENIPLADLILSDGKVLDGKFSVDCLVSLNSSLGLSKPIHIDEGYMDIIKGDSEKTFLFTLLPYSLENESRFLEACASFELNNIYHDNFSLFHVIHASKKLNNSYESASEIPIMQSEIKREIEIEIFKTYTDPSVTIKKHLVMLLNDKKVDTPADLEEIPNETEIFNKTLSVISSIFTM